MRKRWLDDAQIFAFPEEREAEPGSTEPCCRREICGAMNRAAVDARQYRDAGRRIELEGERYQHRDSGQDAHARQDADERA